jgi:hypothetical protein
LEGVDLYVLFQYGGFLLVVFVLEICAGVSVYIYREKLVEGFDKGLGQSIATYTTDDEKANDFDIMQSTVSPAFQERSQPEAWFLQNVTRLQN